MTKGAAQFPCSVQFLANRLRCFLDVKAESPSRELQEMLQHTTAAWSKHPFCEVSERVANSGETDAMPHEHRPPGGRCRSQKHCGGL